MTRYGQVLKLKPNCVDEYVRQHTNVWSGVLKRIKKSNISNYSIFLKDDVIFAYFEYHGANFQEDMLAMAADNETQRWWSIMEPLQVKWASASGEEWWCNMAEVFHLD